MKNLPHRLIVRRFLICFLPLCCCALNLSAQRVSLDWALQLGSDQYSLFTHAIRVEDNGDFYLTGSIAGTIDFDPGPGVTNLVANGQNDFYVAKYSTTGALRWAKVIGGPSDERARAITTDKDGSVFVTGAFRDSVDFDPGPGTAILTSQGSSDIFVLKLDTHGNFQWVVPIAQGPGGSRGIAITTDAAGNVLTGGHFNGTLDFNPGPDSLIFSSVVMYEHDAFIHKLDSAGNFVWAITFGGIYTDECRSLVTDQQGNVYATGRFSDVVDFDPGPDTLNVTALGLQNAFVLRLDKDGNLDWLSTWGSIGVVEGYALDLDPAGNVVSVGVFSDTVDFDPGPDTDYHTSLGFLDAYVQKLDSNGQHLWTGTIGSKTISTSDYGFWIATDKAGGIYSGGNFKGTADLDPGPDSTCLTAAGGGDGYIQKLDAAGQLEWAAQIRGLGSNEVRSFGLDADCNVYSIGIFSRATDFDPGPDSLIFDPDIYDRVFVQKLNQCKRTTRIDSITSCEPFTWIDGITYLNSNDSATLILTNAAGCDSVVSLDLTIPVIDDSVTLVNHTLTARSSIGTYQWLDCDNGILTGETAQSFTPISNGLYAVIVTKNGCSDTSACLAVTTVSLEKEAEAALQIYPNPSHDGKFNLQYAGRIERLRVYDLAGHLIREQSDNLSLLDLEGFPRGMYVVRVSLAQGLIVNKEVMVE